MKNYNNFLYCLVQAIFFSLFYLFSPNVHADTEVTPASGGTNICVGGGYIGLGDIRIAESYFSDFSSSPSELSYIISVPADFEFEPGKGTVTAIGKSMVPMTILVTSTEITITYHLENTNENTVDGFLISGLRVRALNAPASGEILRTGGTADQVGNPVIGPGQLNHGTLISQNYSLSAADAGDDATVMLGNSVLIGGTPTANGASGSYDYIWYPSTGLNDPTIANPTASPTATTTYSVTIIDENGCTDMAEVTVTVDTDLPAGPDIVLSGPPEFCNGESLTLTSSENTGNQWYKDESPIPGSNSAELIVNTSGIYQVTHHNGTVNSQLSEPVEVVVNALPADKNIAIQNNYLCNGGSTLIEVLISEVGVDYQLMNGTTPIGSIKSGNGSSIFLSTGSLSPDNYTFQVQAIHQTTLCSRTLSQTVDVEVIATISAPEITVSPSNAVCGATSITLTADAGYDNYKWYKNSLYLSSSTANTLVLTTTSASGLYKVIGSMNSPLVCESDFSNEEDIKLNSLPQQKTVSVAEELICKGTTTNAILENSELGVLYRIRNNADDSFVGQSVGGTGTDILFPLGVLNETTTYNVLAANGTSGCTVQMDDLITVNVNADIIATATTETDEICFNGEETIILKVSAAGGTGALGFNWTGPNGYSSILQDPEPFVPLSSGNHLYQVEITDETGCVAIETINVLVNALPTVYLTNNTEDNEICDGDPVRFMAFGAAQYEFYVDDILVQEQSTNHIYQTSLLEDNQKVKVIGYNDKGCSSESTEQVFIVNLNPPSFFTGLNAEYCINEGAIQLTGIPSGGVFSGDGIRGSEFIPEFAGIGPHLIHYTTNSLPGCDSTYSISVLVKNSPQADFVFGDVCAGVAMVFEDTSTPNEEINAWEWDFGDGSNIINEQNPNHLFPAAGKYNVTLKVFSLSGCYNSITKQVTVGSIPQPDFTFQQICEGSSTIFTNLSSKGILTYSWNFGDPSSGASNTSSLKDPEHVFSGVGSYNVILTVTTELCTEIFSRTVHILPSINADQFPFHEDFEINNGGWVASGQNSSWIHGKPSGQIISVAGSGKSAWSTQANGNSYFDNEQSYVLSPCFDFSTLIRPMISLQIWNHTDKAIDGTVLQYSLDNGHTWSRLGNIGEGLEWYNQGSIISQPGGYSIGQEGWSGKFTGWRTARFNLDFLKNEPSVRFRIAFGSVPFNGNRGDSEGFAFDNIWIGERKKLVVLEHFTNASKTENDDADVYVNNLTETNSADVISIHYHTDRPQVTPINLDNTADPSARSQYYGISQTPRAVLDGNFYNGKSTDWDQNHLKYRSLVEPIFDIDIDLPNTTNDQVEVNAVITSRTTFNDEIVVHIAVIEEEFFMNDGKVYKNVVKKLLPDGAGTSFTGQWQVGTFKIIHGNWNVDKMYGEGRPLKVIVYVQNNNTKEILQANFILTSPKRNSLPTGLQDDNATTLRQKVQIFPVPTNKEVTCTFSKALLKDSLWKVSDLRGVILKNGTLKTGSSKLIVDTSLFPEGIYFLQVGSDKNDHIVGKIIVKH